MRRTADELEPQTLTLLYIAGNVADAERAEQCLTDAGVDYVLSLEPFTTPIRQLLGWQYTGLFFYVPEGRHDAAAKFLHDDGFTDTVPLDEME